MLLELNGMALKPAEINVSAVWQIGLEEWPCTRTRAVTAWSHQPAV